MMHIGGSDTMECRDCGSRLIEGLVCLTCDSINVVEIKRSMMTVKGKQLIEQINKAKPDQRAALRKVLEVNARAEQILKEKGIPFTPIDELMKGAKR